MRPGPAPTLLASSIVFALAACGADPDSGADGVDLDALSSASCDALAITCCDRESEGIAVCAPTPSEERWFCDDVQVGTPAYDTYCASLNPASCGTEHPLATGSSAAWRCSAEEAGDVCLYPGIGCVPNTESNVCTCLDGDRWTCGSPRKPVVACLPATEDGYFSNGARPLPRWRVPTEACPDPADAARDSACAPTYEDRGSECTTSEDCAATEVCLEGHVFGAGTGCTCVASECVTDDDCADGELCSCGTLDGAVACGGPGQPSCGHRCLPATCRSDAVCGPDGVCAGSPDPCGWQVERYACMPLSYGCLNDLDCTGHGGLCRFSGLSWQCTTRPACD